MAEQAASLIVGKVFPGVGQLINAFSETNRQWIGAAADVLRWGGLEQELRVLEEMAGPGGIDEFAKRIDQALAGWPEAKGKPLEAFKLTKALLERSTLLDSRFVEQVLPTDWTEKNSRNLQALTRFDVSPERQERAEQEITQQIQQNGEVHHLSFSALQYLVQLLKIVGYLLACLATYDGAKNTLCATVPKVLPSMTASGYGKVVRAAMCEAAIPAIEFGRYRIVKGEGVHLRTAPGMKSAFVAYALQDMDLLEIIDDTNRDWLYVAIVHEPGVTGWVSRKYTHRLNR
ncbi:hypothetical protein QV12_22465 [Pseudomonas putida]|nr:hypothetical protein QV12_22465 [Pseudomonas putida]